MTNKATFPTLVEAYFTDRLTRQRQASPNTIASHRDTFRLLLGFAQRTLKKGPSQLTIEDLTPSFIGSFLDHLEKERGNAARTRNVPYIPQVEITFFAIFRAFVSLRLPLALDIKN